MVQKIQPMVLWGWREATIAPTTEKGSHVTKVKTVSRSTRSYGSSGSVGLVIRDSAIPLTRNATASTTSDHANQEAVRVLIPPTPRSCCPLVPSVTTPLYMRTVSRALRVALRSQPLSELLRTPSTRSSTSENPPSTRLG